MFRQRLELVSVSLLLAFFVTPPVAAQRSWDDSGNDASKEWSITGNWNPDGTPAGEPITIGDLANATDDTTIVDQNFTIDSLTVSNGADVDTSGNELLVQGLTTIGGLGVNIFVDPGATATSDGLDSEGITVNNDATLRLVGNSSVTHGGVVELESGLFQINPQGLAGGHGTIELINAATVGQAMENSGTLFVSSRPGGIIGLILPGTLTITNDDGGSATLGTGTLDLDGDGEAGVVDVDDGALVFNSTSLTLNIDVPITDGFGGTMDIGNGDTVDVANAWVMDSDGILNFNGTGTHTLNGGLLTVNGAATQVNMNAGTTVFQNNLTVTDGDFALATDATVQFSGTTTFADGTDFTTGDNPTIIVNAAVDIGDATVDVGEDFNWDGATLLGQTIVNAAGDLDINVENIDAAGDSYGGVITMNSGNIDVQVADGAWIMNGTLNINNSAADIPLLSGDSLQIGNDTGALDSNLNAGGTGASQISAPVIFASDADVNVAAGATLELNSTVTFNSVNAANNAEFTGDGLIEFDSTVTVTEATTIDMPNGRVDLDGFEGPFAGTQTLTVDADYTLNVAGIDAANNNYGKSPVIIGTADTIVLNGFASLTVNLTDPNAEWTLTGPAELDINAVGGMLGGSGIQGSDFNMAGTTTISGNSIWTARTDISGTVDVAAAGSFNLRGGDLTDANINRLVGGTITGAGQLRALNNTGLFGFGTIDTDISFLNNTHLRADDGILTINGSFLAVRVLGTADTDGILNIPAAWNSATGITQVDMLGGEIRGGTITNDNASGISGFGLISSRVINNTRLTATHNGTLIVETAANNNDWDGAAGTGQLNANAGNLEIRDTAAFLFAGTVTALAGRTVLASGFELEFEPASTLSLTGGTYRSTNATDIGGTVTIGAGVSTLANGGTTVFESTSATALTGELRLDNPTRIDAGATFAGGGTLTNVAGRTLTLVDGADVDVLLQNDGTLVLGASAGQTQGLDFQQNAGGAWDVELGGTGINDFDRMTLTGLAAVDGTLNLALIGGYVPALADPALTILTASSVSGTFDVVNQPATMPAGLMFDVVYNAGNIQLLVSTLLLGDYNQNGTVDAPDYVLWRNTLGSAVTPFSGADGDGDGTIDNDDYGVWTANFGETAGSGSGAIFNAAVPEPSGLLIGLLIAGAGFLSRFSRAPLGSPGNKAAQE